MIAMDGVDAHRTAAIGFCFGGKCVIDAARANIGIKAAVSFHGLFDKPDWLPESPASIEAAILVLHGWDDPLAQPSDVLSLAAELTTARVDWQLLAFGHTGHAFTHPRANSPETGMAYDERASRRAWRAAEVFLEGKL